MSKILFCRAPMKRNGSSLHDWTSVPTNSEFVAKMQAFSSLRLTPAMEVTSLMSSSSLIEKKESFQWWWYVNEWFKRAKMASPVTQLLRICLPMQGTRVRALVWEDPTCRGATGPVSRTYWACAPVSHTYWACASGACAPQQERPR